MKSTLAEINAKVGWMNLWVDGLKKKMITGTVEIKLELWMIRNRG